MLEFLKDRILSFIYPHRCMFCEEITAKNDLICSDCAANIKIDTSVRLLTDFTEGKVVRCISPFRYKDNVRSAICRFKFKGYRNYVEFFSEIIADEIRKIIPDMEFDIVSAVPLSKERRLQRGYNQSQWLAQALSEKLNVPYRETLVKTRDNLPQHKLPLNQRVQNIKGVYESYGAEYIRGKNILLCDDIITTGNTLKECVKVLNQSGAKNIVCCTIAYVQLSSATK